MICTTVCQWYLSRAECWACDFHRKWSLQFRRVATVYPNLQSEYPWHRKAHLVAAFNISPSQQSPKDHLPIIYPLFFFRVWSANHWKSHDPSQLDPESRGQPPTVDVSLWPHSWCFGGDLKGLDYSNVAFFGTTWYNKQKSSCWSEFNDLHILIEIFIDQCFFCMSLLALQRFSSTFVESRIWTFQKSRLGDVAWDLFASSWTIPVTFVAWPVILWIDPTLTDCLMAPSCCNSSKKTCFKIINRIVVWCCLICP